MQSTGKALVTLKDAVDELNGQLVARREEYAPSLPSHISPERFQRTVVTAANLNPDLLKADRRSLLNECAKAANDGLLPDGRDGALVIFNKKEKDAEGRERYIKSVKWMPMVAGIIKKARQSGEIAVLDAQIVYSNEIDQGKFTYKRVDGVPKIDHEPIIAGPRGVPVLVYSVVKFKDGSIDYEVLHADDVAKIRAVSRSKDKGPWSDWTEEMWKKSAIRRHSKRLPVSSELFDTIARDDDMTEFERQRQEAESAMLSAAKSQLGGPPKLIEGEVLEGDAPEGDEEAPLARAARLLAQCKTPKDVSDLIESVWEELADDMERQTLEEMGQLRMKEFDQ